VISANVDFNFLVKSNKLSNHWWRTNVNKLALIAIETLSNIERKNNFLKFQIQKPIISFSVSIVNNRLIKRLNCKYRNKNKSTDVLSFPTNSSIQSYSIAKELGDIVISIDKLKYQAREYNHPLEREAAFLLIHGLLHLLGYDHKDLEQEKEMFALQELILSKAGFERG
jgi:probable rRNA maturation factor